MSLTDKHQSLNYMDAQIVQGYFPEEVSSSEFGVYQVSVCLQYDTIFTKAPLCQTDNWEQAKQISSNLFEAWARIVKRERSDAE